MVTAPDGQRRVVLSGNDTGSADVYFGKRLIGTIGLSDLSAGIFVKWAPDSTAFYLMWSDGGVIGGYNVRVFRVSNESVTEVPTTQTAERDFTAKHKCEARGVNVFAIKWEGGSNALLIATQVYPTGDCGKEMGYTEGYLVATDTGVIRDRLPQPEIETEMKQCPTHIWPDAFTDDKMLQSAKRQAAHK